MQNDLVKTRSWHLSSSSLLLWITLLNILLLFFNLFDFIISFHVPETSLLVVISTEINDILDKIDDQIMLNHLKFTFVGLIKF